MMKCFWIALAAFFVFSASTEAQARSARDNSVALFNATQTWAPFAIANDGFTWFLDPTSINLVDLKNREFNITRINSQGHFDPENTFTMRLNCEKLTIQTQGWRIGTAFIRNTDAIGIDYSKSTRISMKPGSVFWELRGFICGLPHQGGLMFHVVSFSNEGKMDAMSIFGNVIEFNSEEIFRVISPYYPNDWQYLDCKNFRFLNKSGSKNFWSDTAPAGSMLAVYFTRICRETSGFFQRQRAEFELPPISESPSQNTSAAPPSAPDLLEAAKEKCKSLGFKPGTEKFGECVLTISE